MIFKATKSDFDSVSLLYLDHINYFKLLTVISERSQWIEQEDNHLCVYGTETSSLTTVTKITMTLHRESSPVANTSSGQMSGRSTIHSFRDFGFYIPFLLVMSHVRASRATAGYPESAQ